MSIQKHINNGNPTKQSTQNQILQYRVRNLSRNHSMKLLNENKKAKKNILSRINNKYVLETSFFSKQNINQLQVQSEQDLPKYSINMRKQKDIKRNASHRILRKANSHQILPESNDSIKSPINMKESIVKFQECIINVKDNFFKNQNRKMSLKKKVQLIRRKVNQDKSTFFSCHAGQIKSQQLLGQKKKSKSKLKILVRDPFQSIFNERKKSDLFLESKIQSNLDASLISQDNRKQFEEFLSCIH